MGLFDIGKKKASTEQFQNQEIKQAAAVPPFQSSMQQTNIAQQQQKFVNPFEEEMNHDISLNTFGNDLNQIPQQQQQQQTSSYYQKQPMNQNNFGEVSLQNNSFNNSQIQTQTAPQMQPQNNGNFNNFANNGINNNSGLNQNNSFTNQDQMQNFSTSLTQDLKSNDFTNQNANQVSHEEIQEMIDETIEKLIEEKWENIVESITKIVQWKEKQENEMGSLKEDLLVIKDNFEKLEKKLSTKISDYDRNILDVNSEIKALEKVFQKITPTLVNNVNELSKIAQDLKGVKTQNSVDKPNSRLNEN